MYRPPDHTPATIEDFRSSGWESACKTDDSSYFSRSHELLSAAVDALRAGESSRSKILWLLGDACAMRLDPGNLNNPFGSISRENGKTFRLENFADADLELLQLACDEINDVLLRARVADILWVRFRKHNFALMAVEAYRRIPIRGDSWMLDGVRDCWHRAVVLARQVKQSGEKYLSEMEADLLAASLEEIEVGDMAPTLVEKLLELGLAREHWPSIGEGLVKRSDRISASSGPSVRYLVARTCLSLARHCFNVSKCEVSDDHAERRALGLAQLRI